MPNSTAPIPFTNKQTSGLEELAGASPVAMNVVTEPSGTVRRRPGLSTVSVAPEDAISADGIEGLHVAGNGSIFAVTGPATYRRIYLVAGGVADDISGGAEGDVRGAGRPVFAETEMLLVIAAGSYLQKIELLNGNACSRLGGSPPEASHILANKLRLLANDVEVDKTKVRYSDVQIGTTDFSGHELWSGGIGTAGYYTAESRPDPVVAIGENTNEIFVWGTGTTQVFAPDAGQVYAPVSTREVGCSAGASIVKVDQEFFWLDDSRRFVMSNGRSFTDISSEAIAKTLDSISDVSDCFGYRVLDGFVDAIVWTFPADGRTFVFQKGAGWGQWSGRAGGAWTGFPVTALAVHPTLGNLIATTDGRIGELSMDTLTDFGDPIDAYVQTGFLDHGTRRYKQCERVRFTLRRGQTTGSSGPQAVLRYRDRPGAWESSIPIDLGVSGDTETVVELWALGTYRKRDWLFEFSGTDELVLVHAEEDFEVLDS
jgi:hypothetical protein